ncbi:YuiA family protein [Halalkalibacter wakoensis]|nr:YuiA family protein [Halalkalibacter wakoensis]
MRQKYIETVTHQCSYCKGAGYFQLLLGGSETCNQCNGEGIESEDK